MLLFLIIPIIVIMLHTMIVSFTSSYPQLSWSVFIILQSRSHFLEVSSNSKSCSHTSYYHHHHYCYMINHIIIIITFIIVTTFYHHYHYHQSDNSIFQQENHENTTTTSKKFFLFSKRNFKIPLTKNFNIELHVSFVKSLQDKVSGLMHDFRSLKLFDRIYLSMVDNLGKVCIYLYHTYHHHHHHHHHHHYCHLYYQ